ncbi:MAG TPA: hypothetical protein VI756_20850 [Blastocatellia bacterium]
MIEAYRRDYEDFNAQLMNESYLYNSGQKAQLEIGPIYQRFGHLFDMEAIARLQGELEGTPAHFESQRVSITHFLVFAVNQYLDASVKGLTEEISREEAAASTGWRGRNMTFQDSAVAISTESIRASRNDIYNWRLATIAASNDLRAERIEKLHEAAALVAISDGANHSADDSDGIQGYGATVVNGDLPSEGQAFAPARSAEPSCRSYAALYRQLSGLDLESIGRQCQSLLDKTESIYLKQLNLALNSDLGIPIEEATRPDGMYFMHLPRFDDRFPAGGVTRAYRGTMEGLGINTERQNNIVIDDEARPHKAPRAFCAPIRVPDDVRLVIRPFGGQADYISFLHEGGHAQHYGWTSAALPSEFKYTGDPALTETYAFLFNHLPSDALWLEEFLGFGDWGGFIRSSMLTRLFTVRRYAGKFIFEMKLHSGAAAAGTAGRYADLLTDATRFKTSEAEYLFDLDDGFYSAGYLRAWAFEVGLREYVTTRYGRRWWSNRRAGTFLREIWETGDRYNADEMAAQIGIGPIDFDLLTGDFLKALG